MIKRIALYCFCFLATFTAVFANKAPISVHVLTELGALVSEEYEAYKPDLSLPTATESQTLFTSITSRRSVRRLESSSNDFSYNISSIEIFFKSLFKTTITHKKKTDYINNNLLIPLNGCYLALHRLYLF